MIESKACSSHGKGDVLRFFPMETIFHSRGACRYSRYITHPALPQHTYLSSLQKIQYDLRSKFTLLMSGQRPTAPCSFALAQPVQQIMTLHISASADNAHSQSEPTNRGLSVDNIPPSRFPYSVVPKKNNQHLVTVPFLVQDDIHFLESRQHVLMGTLLG